MAYSEASIRAQIKTVLEGVSNAGVVYDYERYSNDWSALLEQFRTTINGVEQIRAWMISLDPGQSMRQELIGFEGTGGGENILVTYSYRIRGFMGVDDAAESEKTFTALALAVMEALEADATLMGKELIRDTPIVASMTMNYTMLAGVLCHGVEIRVNPQEVVG